MLTRSQIGAIVAAAICAVVVIVVLSVLLAQRSHDAGVCAAALTEARGLMASPATCDKICEDILGDQIVRYANTLGTTQ